MTYLTAKDIARILAIELVQKCVISRHKIILDYFELSIDVIQDDDIIRTWQANDAGRQH